MKNLESKYPDDEKLERAKKRVEEIKGFYTHLLIYILVNLFLFIANAGVLSGSWDVQVYSFSTPFFW